MQNVTRKHVLRWVAFAACSVAAVVGAATLAVSAVGLEALIRYGGAGGAAGWGAAAGLGIVVTATPIGLGLLFIAGLVIGRAVYLLPTAALAIMAVRLVWEVAGGGTTGGTGQGLTLVIVIGVAVVFAGVAMRGTVPARTIVRSAAIFAAGVLALVPIAYAVAFTVGRPPAGTAILEARVESTDVRVLSGVDLCIWTSTPIGIPGVADTETSCTDNADGFAMIEREVGPAHWIFVLAHGERRLDRIEIDTDGGTLEIAEPGGQTLFAEVDGRPTGWRIWLTGDTRAWIITSCSRFCGE